MSGAYDQHGDKPRVALGAQIAGEVGEHTVEQLVGVGRFGFGLIKLMSRLDCGILIVKYPLDCARLHLCGLMTL